MKEDWKECKLGEIMDLIGGGTPKTSNPDYWDGDIPWISVKDFNGERRYVGATEKKITQLGLKNSSTKILSKNDLIISARGTVGELAIIPSEMAFNQSCYGIRPLNFVNYMFLYYLLKQSVNILKHNTHGSVFDTITRETFDGIPIKLPPLVTQQKIAQILSSLDDKIELNNKINDNLEQQAQAIFKSWFVDFEPFGGVMPEGWKEMKAEDYFDITIGKTPPRKEQEWFSEKKLDNNVKWVSISDMGNCGTFISETSEYLTSEATKKFNIKIIPKDTVILSFKLTVGRVAITDDTMCTNEAIAHFGIDTLNVLEYLYIYLKNFNYQTMGSTSSIATAVNSKIIKAMPFVLPDAKILANFHKHCSPIFEQIRNNQQENKTLTNFRDTLLPKLINGEIEVDSIQI